MLLLTTILIELHSWYNHHMIKVPVAYVNQSIMAIVHVLVTYIGPD